MSKAIVFKFGGASVKDADSIKNLFNILFKRLRNPMVLVVSAIGKTTNALEEILQAKFNNDAYSLKCSILRSHHMTICESLFPRDHDVFLRLDSLFDSLEGQLKNELSSLNYDEYYDQVIVYGELASSLILQAYIEYRQVSSIWIDARKVIKTNSDFRFAKVSWNHTQDKVNEVLLPWIQEKLVVTQGFIGSDESGKSTTLGREGSDFSAAIIASCLDADSVTIWKDVAGVLNADPKKFKNTRKFEELDYHEAAELTYYGASVIHPKTIKPLANKHIPLYVKSFVKPEASGTKIHKVNEPNTVPCIVMKENQVLVTFKVTDFTFINESHIHSVYEKLEFLKLKVNLLQVSGISISIVIDDDIFKLDRLLDSLSDRFQIKYNKNLFLITIKNPNQKMIKRMVRDKVVMLEQITRYSFQVAYKLSTN
ncbi:aspartate kinase [Belliella kenyensis]|uniref:Aspartokinase n=1 Tax=Belliella kenyensis TaxID=1472724 RepID=A0ABV8EPP7_9BACT|nr:aspartate kinase [Belliella kenyensis]MCH7402913.1 aspartate kinase [Belliella kenyensis]MDN3602619.1 aspartate kinase [Belliella kenyensis]